MLSALIRKVMDACSLKQADLAAVLAASLDRVKGLSSGRIKKLKPNEMETLVTRLRIRPDWIVSGGQGPMFMTQREHAQWLAAHAIPAEQLQEVRRVQESTLAWPDGQPPRSKAEVELLADWRACSKKDRETVSDLAARLAKA